MLVDRLTLCSKCGLPYAVTVSGLTNLPTLKCFKLFCRICILRANFYVVGTGRQVGRDYCHEAGGFVLGYDRKRAKAFPLHLSLKLKLPIL